MADNIHDYMRTLDEDVTIPLKEYYRLLEIDAKMDALEAAGIDNWEGYDIAMTEYYQPYNEEN